MPLEMKQGEVTSVSPFLVAVGASTIGTPARKGASYVSPAVGDSVTVFVQGADRFVADKNA